MRHFYEKADWLLEQPTNVTFEDVLWMSDDDFRSWCIQLRKDVVYSWDVLGTPPRVGYNEQQIIEQFRQMEPFPVNKMLIKDDLTGEKNVIRNTNILGNAVNQWFETMMKTPINYTNNIEDAKSIYDYFAKDELLDTFITYASRHFKRDSFYEYSRPIEIGDTQYGNDLPMETDPITWILEFHHKYDRGIYSYWLAPTNEKDYTGYNEKLIGKQYLTITKEQMYSMGAYAGFDYHTIDITKGKHTTNVNFDKSETYQIRVFKLGQKLFPIGFKAWRVSFCQYATNFPPLVAKFLYEKFTEQYKDEETIYVWDPSMGWGGRLLGAMSVKDDRHITYLGNDPNEDHYIGHLTEIGPYSKYDDIYKFYRNNVQKGGMWDIPHNCMDYFCQGSEVMHHNKDFQQYRGKISFIFTSPPYFAKEAYSNDDTQSYKKFPSYDRWRDEFLYETLKTAYEWLRPGGHLAWNISDVLFGKDMLPLVQDSKDICEKLGFKYIETMKLSLAQMPGGNRIDTETGLPKSKYYYKTNGMFLKYEPILIFQKDC